MSRIIGVEYLKNFNLESVVHPDNAQSIVECAYHRSSIKFDTGLRSNRYNRKSSSHELTRALREGQLIMIADNGSPSKSIIDADGDLDGWLSSSFVENIEAHGVMSGEGSAGGADGDDDVLTDEEPEVGIKPIIKEFHIRPWQDYVAKQKLENPEPEKVTREIEFEVQYLYADGSGVKDAQYEIYSIDTGSVLCGGVLSQSGAETTEISWDFRHVDVAYFNDPNHVVTLVVSSPEVFTGPEAWMENLCLEMAKNAKGLNQKAKWKWYALDGVYIDKPVPGQIIANAVITALPKVNQKTESRVLVRCMHCLACGDEDTHEEAWHDLFFTLAGSLNEDGHLIKATMKFLLGKPNLEDLLALYNHFRKGHALTHYRAFRDQQFSVLFSEITQNTFLLFRTVQQALKTIQHHVPKRLKEVHKALDELMHQLSEQESNVSLAYQDIYQPAVDALYNMLYHYRPQRIRAQALGKSSAFKQQRALSEADIDKLLSADVRNGRVMERAPEPENLIAARKANYEACKKLIEATKDNPALAEANQRLKLNNDSIISAEASKYIYDVENMRRKHSLELPPSPIGLKIKNTKQISGLEKIKFSDPNTGLGSALFESSINGKTILTFRGTNNDVTGKEDWKTNIFQGLGLETMQYTQAMELSRQVDKSLQSNFIISGHSLGGGLASAAVSVTGAKANTYDAAGLHWLTPKREDGLTKKAMHDLIDMQYVEMEIVTGLQTILKPSAPGQHHRLPSLDGGHPVTRHDMKQVIDGINAQKKADIATLKKGGLIK